MEVGAEGNIPDRVKARALIEALGPVVRLQYLEPEPVFALELRLLLHRLHQRCAPAAAGSGCVQVEFLQLGAGSAAEWLHA